MIQSRGQAGVSAVLLAQAAALGGFNTVYAARPKLDNLRRVPTGRFRSERRPKATLA